MLSSVFSHHGGEYMILVENLSFSSFSKLMEAALRTDESVRGTLKSNASGMLPDSRESTSTRKRPIFATYKGIKLSDSDQPSKRWNRRSIRLCLIFPRMREGRCTLRTVGEGPDHSSSLYRLLPFHIKPKATNHPYNRRKGNLSNDA